MSLGASTSTLAHRAELAEQAVLTRHLRSLWGIPGSALGVVSWPWSLDDRLFVRWSYWWQAQLLDCLIDAELRAPGVIRRRRIRQVARAVPLRNGGRWSKNYFDDMAWMALALQRGSHHFLLEKERPLRQLTRRLLKVLASNGSVPWRQWDAPLRKNQFHNVPANGPAAILLARSGKLAEAEKLVSWMHHTLEDPATGLLFDGVRHGQVERVLYSYCQGLLLGAHLELWQRHSAPGSEHRSFLGRTVTAVAENMSTGNVLHGHGGGDGGLFTAILARYLARVAISFRDDRTTESFPTLAGRLVLESAQAAWTNRSTVDGLPIFGADWRVPAVVPRSRIANRVGHESGASSAEPERDLSVQLGGWMLLEAAAAVHRSTHR
jgi:predicted alpha-1,6-mannanase (GH76 family)